MAKLSAHGNEIARATLLGITESGKPKRNEIVLMEDRATLSKLTIDGHSYGWKLDGKLPASFSFSQWIQWHREHNYTIKTAYTI